jgi:acyl-CoA thioester hydrolase
MIEHRYHHRVRYRECDPMGVVYHAHYVDHFEAARTEAFRARGLPYSAIEESGVAMPVVEMQLRFLGSARYDDLIEVLVRFPETPTVRVTAEYEVRRLEPYRDVDPLVTGTVTLCFIDRERQRPIRAPQAVLDAFARSPEIDG